MPQQHQPHEPEVDPRPDLKGDKTPKTAHPEKPQGKDGYTGEHGTTKP